MPAMHTDETPTVAGLVRRLLEDQLPAWAELPIVPVPAGGTDNVLYRLGDEMVVRLPRHERTADTLERERRWLPRLAPHLPLAVPVPLAEGIPAHGFPWTWSVYGWLDGETATPERIADPAAFASDLSAFVAALWRIDPSGGPPPDAANAFRGVPLVERDAAVRASIEARGDTIDNFAVTEAWEDALAASEWEGPPVWIHGDLDSRNLLVREGRLAAVLDFGCIGVGDPACDVAVAWKSFTGELRERFRSLLGADDATWRRGRGWTLSQALMVEPHYTMKTNPTLVLESRRWLADVLAAD